ncbi:MAG: hypothetical protein ACKVIY_14570 [Acidimicrobiales bacterium]
MHCLVIFGAENAHPLAWLLNRKRRHVWCALQDTERNMWVSYDWHQGLPVIKAEAAADFDLAGHYRDQGYEVVKVDRGTEALMQPLILNNCVGHVKVVCAIKSWAMTPHQLHRSIVGPKGFIMKLKHFLVLPGFGGKRSSPPPPPAPLPPPPTKADPAVVKARTDAQRRLRQQRGMSGTQVAKQATLGTASTANKTLLGN